MLKKIKTLLVIAAVSLGVGAPALVPSVAFAVQSNNVIDSLCKGSNDAANGGNGGNDCTAGGTPDADSTLKTVGSKIVNIFSIIIGIIAVIMIIYGGFRYITSGGDSGRVGNAKNTLIYAIVGLIIVALAQFIVHYVIQTTSSSV